MAGKTQTTGGLARSLGYGYNAAGQLATLTTPSGQQIGYGYLNGRVVSVTVNGTPLASGIVTTPFGPVGAWQWGNGRYTFRDFDHDGRLIRWTYRNGTDLLRSDVTFDAANRITALADPLAPARSGAYQYDALDRLTVAQQGSPVTRTWQYGYDALGNRTAAQADAVTTTLTYAAGSQQLQQVAGGIVPGYLAGRTSVSFAYNHANRLTAISGDGVPLASYAVNGLGQRIVKTVGGVTTHFVYDEQGRLVGEYDGAGNLIQETVWLDELPLATLRPTRTGNPTPIAIHYVHADHLGTPRAVTRPGDDQLLWRWDNTEPFGNSAPDENPAGRDGSTPSDRLLEFLGGLNALASPRARSARFRLLLEERRLSAGSLPRRSSPAANRRAAASSPPCRSADDYLSQRYPTGSSGQGPSPHWSRKATALPAASTRNSRHANRAIAPVAGARASGAAGASTSIAPTYATSAPNATNAHV